MVELSKKTLIAINGFTEGVPLFSNIIASIEYHAVILYTIKLLRDSMVITFSFLCQELNVSFGEAGIFYQSSPLGQEVLVLELLEKEGLHGLQSLVVVFNLIPLISHLLVVIFGAVVDVVVQVSGLISAVFFLDFIKRLGDGSNEFRQLFVLGLSTTIQEISVTRELDLEELVEILLDGCDLGVHGVDEDGWINLGELVVGIHHLIFLLLDLDIVF